MPIRIADLRQREKDLVYKVEDVGEIHLRYRPWAMTPEFEDELASYGTKAIGWAYLVEKIIASWDLEIEEGVPVPLEAQEIQRVPAPVLKGLVLACNEDASPNPKSAESSGAGSFQAGP